MVIAACTLFASAVSIGGCSSSSRKSSCDYGALHAVVGDKHLDLLGCAGVVGQAGVRVTVSTRDTVRVSAPGGPTPRLRTTSGAVEIVGSEIRAKHAGTALIVESGWPCASGAPSCPLLRVVVR